jgi:hypothetical protein
MSKGKVIRSMSKTAMKQGSRRAPHPPRTMPPKSQTPRRAPAPGRPARNVVDTNRGVRRHPADLSNQLRAEPGGCG